MPIIDAAHVLSMSSEDKISDKSYEAISGTAEETTEGMKSDPVEKMPPEQVKIAGASEEKGSG